jgi:hypothetical protein
MNGREIKAEHIGNFNGSGWVKGGKLATAILTLGVSEYFWNVTFADIRQKTTLAELRTLMTHATEHPWAGLTDSNGLPVVATDGMRIRINPRTQQLTDNFGWALFNTQSGLPIVFHDNDIITTDGQQQTIENCVLLNSITVDALLNSGTDFYMSSITTYFGTFDVPVFQNANKDGWNLMNGNSADGIINDTKPWYESTSMGKNFTDWWQDTFGEGNDLLGKITKILGLVLGVIILILLLPIIPPIIKLITLPLVLLADGLKKRKKQVTGNDTSKM